MMNCCYHLHNPMMAAVLCSVTDFKMFYMTHMGIELLFEHILIEMMHMDMNS